MQTGSRVPMPQPDIQTSLHAGQLQISISGDWLLSTSVPDPAPVFSALQNNPEIRAVSFDYTRLSAWDSTLVTAVFHVQSRARSADIPVDTSSLPQGVQHLLRLASSAQASAAPSLPSSSLPLAARLGALAQDWLRGAVESTDFVGQAALSFFRLVRAKAVFRPRDLSDQLHFCGAQALPIVSLISLLVGLILAFVGAVQLKYFGAQIYVADLVGIAMTREMGAMMTGIIMAGRTGAAFAAQLGTMQVNEETDALYTLGISPFDFLVLPRILALVGMMPFLCLYADLVGIMGGAIVGLGMLDLSLPLYWNQTVAAITMPYVWLGVIKSCVFGFIVAFVGCLRGMQAGRSAQAVGQAATSAVVTTIVGIIVVDGLFAVICNIVGI